MATDRVPCFLVHPTPPHRDGLLELAPTRCPLAHTASPLMAHTASPLMRCPCMALPSTGVLGAGRGACWVCCRVGAGRWAAWPLEAVAGPRPQLQSAQRQRQRQQQQGAHPHAAPHDASVHGWVWSSRTGTEDRGLVMQAAGWCMLFFVCGVTWLLFWSFRITRDGGCSWWQS